MSKRYNVRYRAEVGGGRANVCNGYPQRAKALCPDNKVIREMASILPSELWGNFPIIVRGYRTFCVGRYRRWKKAKSQVKTS